MADDPKTTDTNAAIAFESWWSEIEGFGLRSERAVEEIGAQNPERLRAWLYAAYQGGVEISRRERVPSPEDVERVAEILRVHVGAPAVYCRQHAETIVAAMTPAAERWMPIETAPKDGTHILACDARTRYDAWWTFNQRPPTVVHWWPNPGEEGFYTSVNDVEPLVPFSATHWRPLPPLRLEISPNERRQVCLGGPGADFSLEKARRHNLRSVRAARRLSSILVEFRLRRPSVEVARDGSEECSGVQAMTSPLNEKALPVVSDEEVAGLVSRLMAGPIPCRDRSGRNVAYDETEMLMCEGAEAIIALLSRAQAAEAERDEQATDLVDARDAANERAEKAQAELTAARAEIILIHDELYEYERAASYDPMMSGEYRFKGWNRSALDRARKMTEIRLEREALHAIKKDALDV